MKLGWISEIQKLHPEEAQQQAVSSSLAAAAVEKSRIFPLMMVLRS